MAEAQRYLKDTGIALLEDEEVVGSLPFSKGTDGLLLTDKRLFCMSKSRKEAKVLIGLHRDVQAFEFVKVRWKIVLLALGIVLAAAVPILAFLALSAYSDGAEMGPAAPATAAAQGILSGISALVADIAHVGLIAGCIVCALLSVTLIVSYFVTAEARIKCRIGGQEVEGSVSRKQVLTIPEFINLFYKLTGRAEHQ